MATETGSQPTQRSRDSVRNTLLVAVVVSLVCSVLVATIAVTLKPKQTRNAREFQQRVILEVAGLMEPGVDIDALFEHIEPRMVDLATGEFVDSPSPDGFVPAIAARSPEMGIDIPAELDIAKIRRRARYAPVYLVTQDDKVEQLILPVYGAGLWSTISGYIALATDGTSVTGLRFYSHGETPGLGDQIDDPDWLEQWEGKLIFGDDGEPRIEVIRGVVRTGADSSLSGNAKFQVDGLSGATLTGRAVTGLVRYWTGPHGFGPHLQKYWLTDGSEQ